MIVIKSKGRRMGHVARTEETISCYKIFVGKSEGKRPLGKTKA